MNLGIIRNLCKGRPGGIARLASDIGMSEQNLHRCLRDNRIQSTDLEKIAGVLGVNISAFFDEAPASGPVVTIHDINNHSPHHNGTVTMGADSAEIQRLRDKVDHLEEISRQKDETIAALREVIDAYKGTSGRKE